jgi:hypothetical protein
VPLIRRRRTDLPADLAALQWVDFSASHETGWLDLLMTLDTAGIAGAAEPQAP